MKKTLLFGILYTFIFSTLFAQQQVPNGDFENWETHALGFETPVGWDNPNASLSLLSIIPVLPSDDAANGDFSVYLESIELTGLGYTIPGVVTLGIFTVDYVNNTATFEGGVPFSDRPMALKGSIKNDPVPNDSTMVAIIFTKYNTMESKRDTIGGGVMFFSELISNWTNFSVPIYFSTEENPDSMNINVVSSNIFNPQPNNKMYVDNLSFEYEAGINDIRNIVETSIYPNPASDNITFSFEKELNAVINVYSNEGQLVYSGKADGNEVSIDVSSYISGTYYFALIEGSKKISSGQFIISR
jgi:hypothetical protein